ncbi:MAG: septum formation initiator family protein [Elusimicrobiota bacterium]
MPNLKNKKKLYIYLGIILLCLVLFGNRSMWNIVRQGLEVSRLRKNLAKIEQENQFLRKRLYALENNPAYLEREVRKQLGLIQPGETKYKFVEGDGLEE